MVGGLHLEFHGSCVNSSLHAFLFRYFFFLTHRLRFLFFPFFFTIKCLDVWWLIFLTIIRQSNFSLLWNEKKIAEMEGETQKEKRNEWGIHFSNQFTYHAPTKRSIFLCREINETSFVERVTTNKKMEKLFFSFCFAWQNAMGSHYQIDVRICNFAASLLSHLLLQFTHVETRSFTPSIPDTLAGPTSNFAGACRSSLHLPWLLLAL